MPYSYAYAVNDHYTGTDFGHTENSDGRAVKGSYNVQLPDGRKQTVGGRASILHTRHFQTFMQMYITSNKRIPVLFLNTLVTY